MEETEKYQAEVEQTEENPFENQNGTSEGQALLDEGFEQIQEEMVNGQDDGSHLCDSCSLKFATCESKSVQFGIDRYPDAVGKEADRVLNCGSYVAHNLADVVAYSPSPLDKFGPKFEKYLPVPVPEHELAEYAQEMARLHALWVRTKLDAKAFAKSCKEVTDNCEKKELEIAEIINAGEEDRPVLVFWSYDFTHHVKRLVRVDTNQVVEEVALEPEDYQTDLPLFDAVEGAEPVEVFETGTIEGDSGGEDEKTSLIENMDAETIQKGFDLVGGNNDILNDIPFKEVEGDISEGIKTVDLEKGWPDLPERVA